jgi:DNA invertase Pin-like site-specific DNA recombinase
VVPQAVKKGIEEMKTREVKAAKAAIYVRANSAKAVSGRQAQEWVCRDWARKNGFDVDEAHVYRDMWPTRSTGLGPELQRLFTDGEAGAFEFLIFTEWNRLCANLDAAREVNDQLQRSGLKPIAVHDQTPEAQALWSELWQQVQQIARTMVERGER